MGFFDQLQKARGGYIFLSHSHNDIDKVRTIRNDLERDGFEPLCFYLKCLNDDSEIEDLIKREIDAREWFVFLNSQNSRRSKWVTMEREYITRTNSKKIITVDLDSAQAVSDIIYKLSHNLRVFISYVSADTILARRIKNIMEEKDYLVFFGHDSIRVGASYLQIIQTALSEASKEGCVLVLMTEASIRSNWVWKETMAAIQQNGNVIPVIAGSVTLPSEFQFCLGAIQAFRLSENPSDAEIYDMVEQIGRSILEK